MNPEGFNQDRIWEHFQNEGVDSFSQSTGRQEFLVRRLQPGSRMLNVGVGNAELEALAQRKGVDVWCLDPGERAIDRVRSQLGLGERAQVGRCQSMPFPDHHFDALVMSEVLEHLDDATLAATWQEVRRVLRPGGVFLGTVPARENLLESMVVCPHCNEQFHRWGHQRSFSVESLRLAVQHHFSIEELGEHFFIEWDSVGWGRRLQGLIKKFLSWRGVGTYGVARNIFCQARNP
ncbi:MAG: hypothetical protein RLZZ126_1245 [Pseudomonadota bacterium]|jgi:SAM-dependent methyltransferase